MANSGVKYFATITDDAAVGTRPWVNPTNASSDNATYTTSSLLGNDTHYLKCLDGGFSIPAGATITGVVVEVDVRDTTGQVTDKVVSLVKGGTVSGDNKFDGAAWSAADTIHTYGTSTDLWGLSLTPADVNSSTFGVVFQAENTGSIASAQVDYVRMTVHYNLPPFSQSVIIY